MKELSPNYEDDLRGLLQTGCPLLRIMYKADDGGTPRWRVVRPLGIKRSKTGLVFRAKEVEPEGSAKSWRVDRIQGLSTIDSPVLCFHGWMVRTPLKLPNPVASPLGGRYKVLNAFADVYFRVSNGMINVTRACLSDSASIEGHAVNVCSDRAGMAWKADWSLSSTLQRHLLEMVLADLASGQIQDALWKRYVGWYRKNGVPQQPAPSVPRIAHTTLGEQFLRWLRK